MKDYSICDKCVSGQKNIVGRKCQACIDNNLFKEISKERKGNKRENAPKEHQIVIHTASTTKLKSRSTIRQKRITKSR